MDKKRFEIDYNDTIEHVSLVDKKEEMVIIATLDQVEALLEWYCLEFDRILV